MAAGGHNNWEHMLVIAVQTEDRSLVSLMVEFLIKTTDRFYNLRRNRNNKGSAFFIMNVPGAAELGSQGDALVPSEAHRRGGETQRRWRMRAKVVSFSFGKVPFSSRDKRSIRCADPRAEDEPNNFTPSAPPLTGSQKAECYFGDFVFPRDMGNVGFQGRTPC